MDVLGQDQKMRHLAIGLGLAFGMIFSVGAAAQSSNKFESKLKSWEIYFMLLQ